MAADEEAAAAKTAAAAAAEGVDEVDESGALWAAESIEDERTRDGQHDVLVRWVGYDTPTWISTDNFADKSILKSMLRRMRYRRTRAQTRAQKRQREEEANVGE